MTDFPDVKLKAQVNFPSTVAGGAGIDVAKTNGNFTISLAFDDFAPPVTDYDATFKCVLLWDSVSGNYTLAPYTTGGGGGALPATATPLVEGVGAIGVSLKYAREDHVHPAGGGGGSAPLPATAAPLVEGTATVGVSLKYAREDHIHPAGSAGGSLPGGGVNGYLLQTNGTVASWVGFLAAGAGAIIRTWQDKLRDFISVRDYGTDTAGFAAALSANSAVRVPGGSYTATVSVAFDKMLIMESGATISSLSSAGSLAKWDYNPDGMTWTNAVNKTNKTGLQVDLGGYGNTYFGDVVYNTPYFGLVCGIIGSCKAPGTATTSSPVGVAGYAISAVRNVNSIGIYGQADVGVAGGTAWGGNTVATDKGFGDAPGPLKPQIWGFEIDVNRYNADTNILGCDVTGGTNIDSVNLSIGYRLGPLGAFAVPPKKWQIAYMSTDGAADCAFEVGCEVDQNAVASSKGSQFIRFVGRNSGGARAYQAQIATGPNGTLNFDGFNGISIRANSGFYYMVGNGGALSFLQSGRSAGLQTVSGSKGGNAALASLVTALHNLGLITDGTT